MSPCFAQSKLCSRSRQTAPVPSRAADVRHRVTARPSDAQVHVIVSVGGGGTGEGVTGPGCRALRACGSPARDVLVEQERSPLAP